MHDGKPFCLPIRRIQIVHFDTKRAHCCLHFELLFTARLSDPTCLLEVGPLVLTQPNAICSAGGWFIGVKKPRRTSETRLKVMFLLYWEARPYVAAPLTDCYGTLWGGRFPGETRRVLDVAGARMQSPIQWIWATLFMGIHQHWLPFRYPQPRDALKGLWLCSESCPGFLPLKKRITKVLRNSSPVLTSLDKIGIKRLCEPHQT